MAANGIRMGRIMRHDRIFMVPMDHGISMGPVAGISPPGPTLQHVAGPATCVTVHKGLVPQVEPFADHLAILMHLSASTDLAPDPNDKRIVGTVKEAVKAGCDGVSTHLNLGSPTEADQIQAIGAISTECAEWGMPHIAMIYPRGPGIKDPFDATLVAHAARLGEELGADAVKVPYTGSSDTFARVVDGVQIPVIIAGGPKAADDAAFLQNVQGAADAGAAGVSVGRNVFQADDPTALMRKIVQCF